MMKDTTSDNPKNEKLPFSDCLLCFERKISCPSLGVDTLFWRSSQQYLKMHTKKGVVNYLSNFIMLGRGFSES